MDLGGDGLRLAPAVVRGTFKADRRPVNRGSTESRFQVQAGNPRLKIYRLPASFTSGLQVDSQTPWRGIGPLQAASLSGRLSAEVSLALADEFSGPRGQLLPLPNVGGESEQILALKADLRALRGHLAFVESQSDSFGTGPTNSASSGWDSKRIGAKVPDSSIRAAELAFSEVLAAVGLSVALFDGSPGTAKRESLSASAAPFDNRTTWAESRLLSCRQSWKPVYGFDWSRASRAGDMSGRAEVEPSSRW